MSNPTAPPSYGDAVDDAKYDHSATGQPYPSAFSSSAPLAYPQYGAAPSAPYPNATETGYSSYPAGPMPQPQPYVYTPQPPPSAAVYSASEHHPADMTHAEMGFSTRQSFDDKNIRRQFIRRVFIILGLQLLVTFGIVCIFTLIDDVKVWVEANPGMYWASYGVFLVLYIVLVCVESVRRKHPHNLIMLGLFTLALSYMTGTIAAYYSTQSVMIALGVTVVVCVTVILFSMQTKFDFTKCSGVLFVLCMVLFLFGFITIFTYWRSWYLQVVYGCLGALVFTLFLAFDTQLVMGGKKHELEPEEYVYGALTLYIDVVYIFLFILSIFGGSSN
ncbi:protein lifeguard 2-like isoform X2 [Styela clava]